CAQVSVYVLLKWMTECKKEGQCPDPSSALEKISPAFPTTVRKKKREVIAQQRFKTLSKWEGKGGGVAPRHPQGVHQR
uniref:Uncharacterized protein n=1 Tax=Oryzias latipes TaxID=8090 RepID=A0A3P9LS85_ORYLA